MSHHGHHGHHHNDNYDQNQNNNYNQYQNQNQQNQIIETIIIQDQNQNFNQNQNYNQNQNQFQNYQNQNYNQQQNFNQNQNYNQNQNFNQNQNQFQNQNFNQNQNYNQNFNQNQNYNQNQQQNQQQNQYQQQQQQQNDPFFSQNRRVLQLHEKWFSITDNIGIKDEQGNDAYLAQGKFFHLGLDMYLKDSQGTTLCEIKSKIFSLMAEYDFYQNGSVIGKLRKEIHLFTEGWHFEDLKQNKKWQLSGEFLNYDWKIHQSSQLAGEVSKKHSFNKDHYGLQVEPGMDITLLICVAICLEKYHHDLKLFK